MKIKYTILAVSVVAVLMSGCSKKTEESSSEMVSTEAVAADAAYEPTAVAADASAEVAAYGSEENTENYQKLNKTQ